MENKKYFLIFLILLLIQEYYNEKAQFIQLELKVIRYIRHFKKDYISKKHFEKQIPSLTKYIKFLTFFTKFINLKPIILDN